MEIVKTAAAGTFESSDVMVTVSPNPGKGIEINLESIVKTTFGDQILETVEKVLEEMDVRDAIVDLNDKGAIDCVLKARVEAALCRAAEAKFDWSKEDRNG